MEKENKDGAQLLREAEEKYKEVFGEDYFIAFGECFRTEEDAVRDIEKWIALGRPKPEPEYEDGAVY